MGASAQLNGVGPTVPEAGTVVGRPGRRRIKINSGRSEPAGGSVQVADI